jgi:glucose-6-phosphate isomerase
VIALQMSVVELLKKEQRDMTAQEIATLLGKSEDVESIFAILKHLAANPDRGITCKECDHIDSFLFRMK